MVLLGGVCEASFAWMALGKPDGSLVMKPGVSSIPVDIGHFGTDGIVLYPDVGAHLVKQAKRLAPISC